MESKLIFLSAGGTCRTKRNKGMRHLPGVFILLLLFVSCSGETEHTAPAINDRDSASVMTSYGVNTLVSDSGVIKYRIVTECWDVNQTRQPSRWTFIKGVFFEQFDDKFHLQAYVQADTAWYYDQLKLWELRGRVRVRNVNGLRFSGEELFWDGRLHELYSNKFSRLITPERTLQGSYFRSDEQMTRYTVSNTAGSFVKSTVDGSGTPAVAGENKTDTTDTAAVQIRPAATPRAASNKPITRQ